MRRVLPTGIPAAVIRSTVSVTVPPAAHDPEGGDHSGPGSSGPDQHSSNVKLLAKLPKSSTATQPDLAFRGKFASAGNYRGFRVIHVSQPRAPVVLADVHCHGAQGDISVCGDPCSSPSTLRSPPATAMEGCSRACGSPTSRM